MKDDFLTAIVLSGATGSGAYMLTRTEVFAPLHAWVAARTRGEPWLWMKLHALLRCPYCTGTWLAIAAVLIYRPVLVSVPSLPRSWSYWPLGWLVSVMFVNGTAMLWTLIIRKALGK